MGKKIILTGATGYVGEGVLIECLADPAISEVLVVGRKTCGRQHAKLKELLVKDFFTLDGMRDRLVGYDGCFFCAGISSVGMKEEEYTRITYHATLAFARTLLEASPGCVFIYISGAATDSSEKGRMMWARVKGRTENALARLGFKGQYNFRPGIMKPSPGQHNPKTYQRLLVPLFAVLMPGSTCRMQEVGRAMINAVTQGYPKNILEVKDIKALAKG
ncbi:MAG TPA: NAD-dependent epimerase/dehydratase family protein [Flavobacteriales bacterium]